MFKILCMVMCFFSFGLFSKNCVHVIGDSHAKLTFRNIKFCKRHHLGPKLMHSVGRDGLNLLNFKDLGVQEKDAVVLCFGEIDIRCHIGKQRDLYGRKTEEIVDNLVSNFFETILKNKKMYKNLLCIIYLPPPPCAEKNVGMYVTYASLKDRVSITKKVHRSLKASCKKFGVEYIDVYKDYSNCNGALEEMYVDNVVHISPQYDECIRKQLSLILKKHHYFISRRYIIK